MAVYTDLTDAERDGLLRAFGLSPPLAFKGIAEGVSNSNFLVETIEGRFILTIFERRFVEEELPFFMRVMERLAERSFPAPRPLHTRDGGFLAHARGKPACMVSFLEGVSPQTPSLGQIASLGAALAKLHAALAGLDAHRDNALGPQSWPAMIAPRLALAETLRPGLAHLIEADLAAVRTWPQGLPRGVIHADLFPDNTLFLGEELTGAIDFYFACNDYLAYDLAVCLNAWCFSETRAFDRAKAHALLGAYGRIRPLQHAEKLAFPVLARGAALRFFATRLTDWGDAPPGALLRPKDPLEYADKLAFHRTAHSFADYGGEPA